MEKKLEALVENLKQVHATNLVSVVLYGSTVTGEHIEGQSDYNLLVVLDHITPSDLQVAHPLTNRWQKAGHRLPLYFTLEEMMRASDVFPIEFLDMSEAHQVLHGQDPFDGLEIRRHNLRHQLEYELRGKLIRLRELYIPASHDVKRLTALMTDSLSSFTVLFRHVLGLLAEEPPLTKRQTLVRLGEVAGCDVVPFLSVLEFRETKKTWTLAEARDVFSAYLKAVEKVIHYVDELEAGY